YETATFDDTSCSWVVTGTQPDEPTTACYETATFDDASCSWVVTGDQPEEPITACDEIATFNDMTCSWDITISPTGVDDCDCECEGGMVELTLQYNGPLTNANIVIESKKGAEIYSGTHSTTGQFTIYGTGKKNRISNTIYLIVNGVVVGELHTSCSQPIYVGMVIGDFTIVAGESRNNGPLCSSPYKQAANTSIDLFEVKAYPNPSSSTFNLNVKTPSKGKIGIQVFDLYNKQLLNDEFNSQQEYKFGQQLPTGIYIVKIKQDKHLKIIRVIKK
ncbi:T9SS type A sorting domain-containing protein, partial [Bizionia paragorgiae]